LRLLIWGIFIAGVIAAGFLGGKAGAFVYFVAVFLAIVLFRRPLVPALTRLVSRLGLMRGTIEAMPSAITLTRAPSHAEAARPIMAALAASNFTDAGAWNIAQMPKIQLSLMVQRDEGMLAAVESASPIGAHVNLHTLYPDGLCVTFTNTELPMAKVLRPNVQRTRLPRCSPDALVIRARSERPKLPFRPLSIDEAPRLYEQLYADEIRFRKSTGK
jgi:hypothetical protein